jgi:hypothetical protein
MAPAGAELADVSPHPAASQGSEWIDNAVCKPPSSAKIVRMGLLQHWDSLPAEERQVLLLLAREMSQGEQE